MIQNKRRIKNKLDKKSIYNELKLRSVTPEARAKAVNINEQIKNCYPWITEITVQEWKDTLKEVSTKIKTLYAVDEDFGIDIMSCMLKKPIVVYNVVIKDEDGQMVCKLQNNLE